MGWRRARRRYKRWLDRSGRFYLAFAFTVIVVSYVAVPYVARFIDTVDDYNPATYDPKDFARQAYQEQQGKALTGLPAWEVLFKVALLIAVGVVWRSLMPSRGPDRTSPPR